MLEISLERPKSIDSISVGVLKEIRAWIALPKSVAVEVRFKDEDDWTLIGTVNFEHRALLEEEPVRLSLPYETNSKIPVSKIRVHFENAGELMPWHPGAGYPSYFFVDEVGLD